MPARSRSSISAWSLGKRSRWGLRSRRWREDKRRKPVADYVRDRVTQSHDGETWEEWLQTHRVELNAMTTPQFIAWLDGKMAAHDGKLIPPSDVLEAELAERIENKVRAALTERILREAGLDESGCRRHCRDQDAERRRRSQAASRNCSSRN